MRLDRLQLTLALPERHGYDPRDFIRATSNQAALSWLDADWPDRRLAIWGPAGCGKSHLLHIWATRQRAVIRTGPALIDLEWMPGTGAVALDNADLVAPDELLLHTLNTARDQGLALLLTGEGPGFCSGADLAANSARQASTTGCRTWAWGLRRTSIR